MSEAEGRNCAECRTWFTPHRRDQVYCSTACGKKAEAIELRRARRLYRAAYHWRLWISGEGRVDVARNFRFLCAEIGSWIREDRKAQRMPPPLHDHDSDRGHQRARQEVKL